MRIVSKYSHLNGEEYLLVHKQPLWNEVLEVIANVDGLACKTKVSKEKRMMGRALFSPKAMNAAFKREFVERGWKRRIRTFWAAPDEALMRRVYHLPPKEQKIAIEKAGHTPVQSRNETDFVKDRVAVEVQFGKYAFVAHDLFVKHLSFFVSDVIDVGIEILPMKDMEREMSSGVPYYERDLLNVIPQGRGVPAVPLVLLGITPSPVST